MGHPKELLASITVLVEKDYAPGDYTFKYETKLNGTPRLYPDILVFEKNADMPVCVVEIGYTRPEKLQAYSTVYGIQDIRWYSKAGELINPQKIESKVVRAKAPRNRKYLNITTSNLCDDCYAEEIDLLSTDDDGQSLLFVDKEAIQSEAEEAAATACIAEIWSNGYFFYGIGFCDVCGKTWAMDDFEIEDRLGWYDTFNQFEKEHYRRRYKAQFAVDANNERHPEHPITNEYFAYSQKDLEDYSELLLGEFVYSKMYHLDIFKGR